MECSEQNEITDWAKMHEEDQQEIRDGWPL